MQYTSTFENLIHYNIGRSHSNTNKIHLYKPDNKDLFRIFYIMIIFALCQALLSNYLEKFII